MSFVSLTTFFLAVPAVGCSAADCTVNTITISLVDTAGKPLDVFECGDAKLTYAQDSVKADMRQDTSQSDRCVFIPVDTGLDGPAKVHDTKPVLISVTPGGSGKYAAQTASDTVDHCGGSINKTIVMQPAPTM